MRNGNTNNYEFLGQIGFNGFELGAEGPVFKEKSSSFLVNYRLSTLEAFVAKGVDFGTGVAVPKYHDFTYKFSLPSTKAGKFIFFGIGGKSHIVLENEAFELQYPNYFRTDLKVFLKSFGRKSNIEFIIDIQNLFDTQNIYNEAYNKENKKVYYNYQMGRLIIPQFKIEF